MTELQIRLIFVGVFLASILIGLYYVLQTNAFGENSTTKEKIIDLFNDMLNKTNQPLLNESEIIFPSNKICGGYPNPHSANKMYQDFYCHGA